ncbi:P1 family peptidase, partial [Micrococcus sp. SIMBA_144]
MGTIQLNELGTLETPILLTNTLSIGTATDAMFDYMLDQNPEIGDTTGTVNPIIGECNDMFLNDIRGRHVQKHHVHEAIANASTTFEEGSV